MTLTNAKINISKGLHDSDTNLTKAFYVIDVKDLTEFLHIFLNEFSFLQFSADSIVREKFSTAF